MPTHAEKRLVPYSADQMYALIADVGRYPEFLPWCAAARVRETQPLPDGRGEVMEADLVVSFKVYRERFGSRVTLRPDGAHHRRRVPRGAVPLPAEPLALRAATGGRLRDRLLRRLRVPLGDPAEADRPGVPRGDAADRARLRAAGRGALRRAQPAPEAPARARSRRCRRAPRARPSAPNSRRSARTPSAVATANQTSPSGLASDAPGPATPVTATASVGVGGGERALGHRAGHRLGDRAVRR